MAFNNFNGCMIYSEEERARLERQFTELVHGGKAVRYAQLKNLLHETHTIKAFKI